MQGSPNTSMPQKLGNDLTFLFWNLDRKDLLPSIVRLVEQHDVDVLILAECELSPDNVLIELNPDSRPAQFYYGPTECRRLHIFTRFPSQFIRYLDGNDKYIITSLQLPGEDELLFVAAHLLSSMWADETTLYTEILNFADGIRDKEQQQAHKRTLLVGDLNQNPFARGLVSAAGLHAVMSQSIARRGKRIVQEDEYPFFYNPMWRFMSEFYDPQTEIYSPPGTYYYAGSDHVCYFWNTFDQVLLRPSLLDRWNDQNLQVLTTDSVIDFLSERERLPDRNVSSDHLPIVFELMSGMERSV